MFSSDVIAAEKSIFDIVVGRLSCPEGGTIIVQTRIGPSLIKRDSAWLSSDWFRKDLNRARLRLLHEKLPHRQKAVIILYFLPYGCCIVPFNVTVSLQCQLCSVSSGPKGFFTSSPKCLFKMLCSCHNVTMSQCHIHVSRHNTPADQTQTCVFLFHSKSMPRDICLNN